MEKKTFDLPNYKFEAVGPDQSQGPEDQLSPSEVFVRLFSQELFEIIAYNSDLYATQRCKSNKPTNSEKIKMFLAINLLMGIKKQLSYRNYWSPEPMSKNTYISGIIGIDSFKWLI